VYYLTKALQAAGLTIVLIDFIAKFPRLMSHSSLLIGIALFTLGWMIQRFLWKDHRP
jgi:hypothetical protein